MDLGVALLVGLFVPVVDEVLQRHLERVLVDVLLEEVFVVELLFEDGFLVELPDGQLFGGFEVELALGEVGLVGLTVPLGQSHRQGPPFRVRRAGSGAGPRSRLGISIGPRWRLRKTFSSPGHGVVVPRGTAAAGRLPPLLTAIP